jgi:hypothetical protein
MAGGGPGELGNQLAATGHRRLLGQPNHDLHPKGVGERFQDGGEANLFPGGLYSTHSSIILEQSKLSSDRPSVVM